MVHHFNEFFNETKDCSWYDPKRGTYVSRNYCAWFKPELNEVWVRPSGMYRPLETPPVTMKYFPNGNVWFHPVVSFLEDRKQTVENELLIHHIRCSFEMVRNLNERGVRFYMADGNVSTVTAGNALFNMQGKLLSCDPPRMAIRDAAAIAAYDELVKKVKTDLVIRAKIVEFDETKLMKFTWYIDSPEKFLAEVKKINPNNIETFGQLIRWASHRKREDEVLPDSIVRLFNTMRPKVLIATGAIKYSF